MASNHKCSWSNIGSLPNKINPKIGMCVARNTAVPPQRGIGNS